MKKKSTLPGRCASSWYSGAASAKKLIAVFVLLWCSCSLFAQVLKPENKIDPAFRFLLANEKSLKDTAVLKTFPERFNLKPTKGFLPGRTTPEERYDCIVYTENAQLLNDSGIIIRSVLPKFVTAWATLEQIVKMASFPSVKAIEAPQEDKAFNDLSLGTTGASLLHAGVLNNTVYKGKGVIVGVLDSGIDWDHYDFRDPTDTTKSRILRIWDQTLTAITGENTPGGTLNYGVEYTQEQINNEIDGTPAGFVREKDNFGHGTHVAGTAAGNGSALSTRKYTGMAPEADLVIIKGGESSFSTTNIINGMTYLQNLATSLGKPVVLNMSLGGQSGPHDGTTSQEVAVNNFSASAPGRVVVIAAGNDNGTNIHNQLILGGAASGTVSLTVPAVTTGTDVFEYRIYANDNSAVSATLTAPDGTTLTAAAGAGQINTFTANTNFRMYLTNSTDAGSGSRYVDVYITRNGTNTGSPAGTWTLSITNGTANTLTMNGWLFYRNTSFSGVALVNGNSDYLVTSPGTATSAITVGSFAARSVWYSEAAAGAYGFSATRVDSISSFSGRGPRRDGVLKPEIAANGEAVISCLSSDALSQFTSSSIIKTGLYAKDQGTSMATPGTAGAVALLLQANPAATYTQVKNFLTNTAGKDVMTELNGPTPNPTWGYGKLDIFRAVSSYFNCVPVDRKTYKYDSSTRLGQEVGYSNTTQRVAVRFTPDITGRLGGVYFYTSGISTALFLEVRANSAGNPGTLLGTVNLDSARIDRYSWNYFDVSNLNIAVTSGADYFVVIGRTSTNSWSLRGEALAVNGRTLQSTDGGTTWAAINVNYKIRSVVYTNSQLTGNIATSNSVDTRNINTSNQFINSSCQLIAQVVPSGTSAVSGSVVANVWLEPGVPRSGGGDPFVSRHYQITPTTSTATGRVTLYFTQAEFTAFNNDAASTLDLPTGPTDNAGKANLRVSKYPGTSSNGTGLPNTYTGTAVIIDPADGDIVWNASASRWEVSFDVTGFSGFFIQTKATVLPIVIEYFTGKKDNSTNVLDWKVNCGSSTATRFAVERSTNGVAFSSIGSVSATQARCTQAFGFTDKSPVSGANYYRIKITEASGNVYYTNIVLLQGDRALTNGLAPTYLVKGAAVQVSFAGASGQLVVNDATGKQVFSHNLRTGVQSISIPATASGIYFYKLIENNKTVVASGKLVVQ